MIQIAQKEAYVMEVAVLICVSWEVVLEGKTVEMDNVFQLLAKTIQTVRKDLFVSKIFVFLKSLLFSLI